MLSLLLLPLLTTAALAVPLDSRQLTGPSVTIRNGTVVGTTSNGVDDFKGIPFAKPPVGDLRLRAPQSLSKSFGTISSNANPKSCPQFVTAINQGSLPNDVVGMLANNPLFQQALNAGEDCLTINVQRPSTATSSSKLPVIFWIYGGGFEAGSTGTYDGGNLIRRSVALNEPVVYVAVNYRLGGFGFLGGKDLAKEGNTNLGLRDQRLGLQWVQDNIGAFGGDPSKVTIWGESAGSISVFDHTVINNGDNTYKGKPLFRGAIMDSGSVIPALTVTDVKATAVYNAVLKAAGCSTAANKLACLRGLSYEAFLDATTSVPGIFSYQSIDLAYLPRPDPGNSFFSRSPELSISSGRFTKVPVIIGDQEDEGTLFSLVQSNITNNEQLVTYLSDFFPTNPTRVADIRALLALYPDQPLTGQPAGSPFRTAALNNIYPEFKRLAAVLGDITFTLSRRLYLATIQKQGVKCYSYLSSYLYGTPVLGTFHGSDIVIAYGDADTNPITKTVQTYVISFANHLDPNAIAPTAPAITWPQWTNANPVLVQLNALENVVIPDDFRSAAYNYLAKSEGKFRI